MNPPTVAPDASHRQSFAAILVLVLALLVAYANSLTGPFVFDDGPAIERNPSLQSPVTAWFPPANGSPVTGRPLLNASFALNRAIGGLEVRGYHAVNLAIHVAAALALFGFARSTLQAPLVPAVARSQALPLAFALTLVWALHPLQTAAVTYVSQRSESLAGLLSILTLYAFARGAGSAARFRWHLFAFVVCLAGIATKEVAAVAPVLALLWDRTFFSGTFRSAWRQHRGSHLALMATWLPLAALVFGTHGRGQTAGPESGVQVGDYLLTQGGAILHYLRLTIWPQPLIFDYGTTITSLTTTSVLSLIAILLLLACTAWAIRQRPTWGFAGGWFFATLAPTSSVVPIATQTIAEHRMYLPVIAVLCLLVIAGVRWAGRATWWTAVATVALALGVTTFRRNSDYATAETLWRDTAAQRPENARAHHNLGQALMAADRPAEAAQSFAAALRLEPHHVKALDGLGSARLAVGDVAGALSAAGTAVELDPNFVAGRVNLGATLARAGRIEEATREFRTALQLDPAAGDANLNLGLLLLHRNQPAEAIELLQKASAILPESALARITLAEAHHRLGLALAQTGRMVEAKPHLQEAVRLQPDSPELRSNLGNVCLQTGDIATAIAEYETALRLDPGLSGVRENLVLARDLLANSRR
jgi:Flp pilus assembly protein TadD